MPVSTVPKPRELNTRWTGRRKTPAAERGSSPAHRPKSVSFSASSPSPVTAETRTIGASARNVPASSERTSSSARSTSSASTMSTLLSATKPVATPSSSMIWRCSRVCGITPSSAATTSTTRSMPLAPATMLRMKRSCPGTSTMPTVRPSGISMGAKPRSIVRPRSFSSLRRSGSMPVKARTRLDLPWSMCPAVPMTMGRMSTVRSRPPDSRRPGGPDHTVSGAVRIPRSMDSGAPFPHAAALAARDLRESGAPRRPRRRLRLPEPRRHQGPRRLCLLRRRGLGHRRAAPAGRRSRGSSSRASRASRGATRAAGRSPTCSPTPTPTVPEERRPARPRCSTCCAGTPRTRAAPSSPSRWRRARTRCPRTRSPCSRSGTGACPCGSSSGSRPRTTGA